MTKSDSSISLPGSEPAPSGGSVEGTTDALVRCLGMPTQRRLRSRTIAPAITGSMATVNLRPPAGVNCRWSLVRSTVGSNCRATSFSLVGAKNTESKASMSARSLARLLYAETRGDPKGCAVVGGSSAMMSNDEGLASFIRVMSAVRALGNEAAA